ncbi:MAG TPA: GMC family oxidoreductase N-terminal domain-containing protein [Thermoleophilaceae bacterium]|nr:GMC family oxidoreductase N-terminal domain-containing protein [Thermoleophilaceae bacterium]
MAEPHDYVIVGAGSAGCVLANRLSGAGARVLLIEAGGSDRKLPVKAPAAFSELFQGPNDWNYLSEPEPGLHGRRWYLPRGRMLGGSSSMNAMLYVRGNRADYDSWGADGWSYDEVLPLFKRSELNAELGEPFHGTGGEMHVTGRRWLSNHWEPFVESAVAAGIERNDDCNGEHQDGAGLLQTTTKGGRRFSAADAFLRPAKGRDELDVVTGALATRVVLEGGRAVGVEYESSGKRQSARAGREVIVAAGAYGSPQLLMLSGIGPGDHLREHGIDMLVESPNVGLNLMEHPMAFANWRTSSTNTLDDAADPRNLLPWLVAGKGKLSSTVAEAAVHWRSEPGLPAPDFQILFAPVYFWEHGFRKTGAPAFSIGAAYIRPQSRGSVRLRSADPADHPRITNNSLTSEGEVEAMLRALELIREIASREPLARLLTEELNPGPGLRSPEELTAWLRATCEHEYHPSCTCRIGSPDAGVVDAELRVHGVEGLRVADASVMPTVTSGNTHAPTVMIAERCSDLLLRD